jgi:hypothetical protein
MSLDSFGLRGAGPATCGPTWRIEVVEGRRIFRGWIAQCKVDSFWSFFEGPRCLDCGCSIQFNVHSRHDLSRYSGGLPLQHACNPALVTAAELRDAIAKDLRGERDLAFYERLEAWGRQKLLQEPRGLNEDRPLASRHAENPDDEDDPGALA